MSLQKSSGVIVLALLMTGCASLNPPSQEPTEIPPSLATPCQPLPSLNDGTAASVLRWIAGASEIYAECSSRHRALVQAWPR